MLTSNPIYLSIQQILGITQRPRSNKHKKNLHNSTRNLHNCGRVQVGSHWLSLDTKSPSGSSSQQQVDVRCGDGDGAFIKIPTAGNMRGIILFGVVWQRPPRTTPGHKGHNRQKEAAADTQLQLQPQRQKAIKTIVGCLLLVNFVSLLPSLPLSWRGKPRAPVIPAVCPLLYLSCCPVAAAAAVAPQRKFN